MFGFDYGEKPRYMVIGDYSFQAVFTKCQALGYSILKKKEGIGTIFELSLFFPDEISAENGYKVFERWIDLENGDAETIEINFIEHANDNGYSLCISQNQDHLYKRNIPEHMKEWINTIYTVVTWRKPFPNRSKGYLKFKEVVKEEPFRLSFSYRNLNNRIEPIKFPPIIKNQVKFLKENEIKKDSFLAVHFQDKSKFDIHDEKEIFEETYEDIIKNRIKNIKYFFPITYEKIENENYLKEQIEPLLEEYEKTEVLQAICNIILGYRLKEIKIDINNLSCLDILEYLLSEFEGFNSLYPEKKLFSSGNIKKQIKLDKNPNKEKKGKPKKKKKKKNSPKKLKKIKKGRK